MLSYLVHFIHAFIPAALILGMLVAFWSSIYDSKTYRSLLFAFTTGLLAGLTVYMIAMRQEAVTAVRIFLYLTNIAAALLSTGFLTVAPGQNRIATKTGWVASLLFAVSLATAAIFSFCVRITEEALSTTAVLNTELILNVGGILGGAVIAACTIPLAAHLSGKIDRKIVAGLVGLASLLLIAPWSAEALLGLMRLEITELTSGRLSFVARTTKYAYLLPYLNVLILAVLALFFFRKSTDAAPAAENSSMEKSELRKVRSRILLDMRWLKSALACMVAITAILLYFDLYASKPPKLSPAIALTPDASGMIRVRIDDVADGNLHRYSYVTGDGHVIRFFMINSLSDSADGRRKIGVVFDACMLCGDMGYIQNKKEIICIACNVRMFVPSIGKEGGCNPIPFKHAVENGFIVIDAKVLDQGARYFSEVISVKVKDPVTGKEMDNLKAPHRYEYKGRIFFFESEQSLKKFQEAPDTYAGNMPSRFYRVQGYVKA